jgi:hypothetical protein
MTDPPLIQTPRQLRRTSVSILPQLIFDAGEDAAPCRDPDVV